MWITFGTNNQINTDTFLVLLLVFLLNLSFILIFSLRDKKNNNIKIVKRLLRIQAAQKISNKLQTLHKMAIAQESQVDEQMRASESIKLINSAVHIVPNYEKRMEEYLKNQKWTDSNK